MGKRPAVFRPTINPRLFSVGKRANCFFSLSFPSLKIASDIKESLCTHYTSLSFSFLLCTYKRTSRHKKKC